MDEKDEVFIYYPSFDMRMHVATSTVLFFYTKVYGLSLAVVGTLFLITRVWDSLINPLMVIIADRTTTRPYLLCFAIPFAVTGVTFILRI